MILEGKVQDRAGIAQFWQWWPSAHARLEQAIDDGDWGLLGREVGERVRAIHPRIGWALSPGSASPHHLALAAAGDPELRRIAQTWCEESPAPDGTWEFSAARAPLPSAASLAVSVDGIMLDAFALTTVFEVDVDQERLHVTLWHPAFEACPEGLRHQLALSVLEAALGAEGLERWIGGLEAASAPLPDGLPFVALLDALSEVARLANGTSLSVVERVAADGVRSIAEVNLAAKPCDNRGLDLHVEVDVRLVAPTPEGLASSDEEAEVGSLQRDLLEELGDGALLLGRETGRGRSCLHLHVAESSGAALAIESWRTRVRPREVAVRVRTDRAWDALKRWA